MISFLDRHPGLKRKNFLNTRVGGLCLNDDGTTLIDVNNDHTQFDRYWLEDDVDATQIDKTIVKRALSLMLKREQENCEFYRNLELCEEELGL